MNRSSSLLYGLLTLKTLENTQLFHFLEVLFLYFYMTKDAGLVMNSKTSPKLLMTIHREI